MDWSSLASLGAPKAPPPLPVGQGQSDQPIGLDPETMLQAERAYASGQSPQLGQSMQSPAPDTQPPPFVPDQQPQPPQAEVLPPQGAPNTVPQAGLSDQAMPLESAPEPETTPGQAPGAPGPDATLPLEPGGAPSQAATAPPAGESMLGPPPAPPPLTGDPVKDSQTNLEYHRQLTTYNDQIAGHGAALAQKQAALNQQKADRELQLEQHAATIRNDESKRNATDLMQKRAAIDKAVGDRVNAYGDLSKGNGFLDQSLGDKVMGAIIFLLGSRQQALTNVANIQSGHAPTAQNEGLNYINKLMDTRYQQKKDKLNAANDAVLEARYGFKDALENHQAATADLDADAAANYRLAAKEVASQAAQLGSEQARQAGLQAHSDLMQKSAEYEQKMLQEQAQLQEKREAAAATNAIAGVHLNQADQQIQATLAQHKETNAEARERLGLAEREAAIRDADRKTAMEDRKHAQELKVTESDEARTYHDPDTGQPVGLASTARGVPLLTDKATAGRQYAQSLRSYADEIEADKRTLPSIPGIGNITDASQRRDEAQARVIALGRKAQEVGVSNANIELEHAQVGGSGKGFTAMPSPKILREMADKADQKVNEILRSNLTPIKGNAVAPASASGSAPATPARNGGGKTSGIDAKRAAAQRVSNDPHAPARARDNAAAWLAANLGE